LLCYAPCSASVIRTPRRYFADTPFHAARLRYAASLRRYAASLIRLLRHAATLSPFFTPARPAMLRRRITPRRRRQVVEGGVAARPLKIVCSTRPDPATPLRRYHACPVFAVPVFERRFFFSAMPCRHAALACLHALRVTCCRGFAAAAMPRGCCALCALLQRDPE